MIEFGPSERVPNIVKNSHLLEQRSLSFIKTEVASYWDRLSHYELSSHCSGLLLLDKHPN